eukprot:g3377.t1
MFQRPSTSSGDRHGSIDPESPPTVGIWGALDREERDTEYPSRAEETRLLLDKLAGLEQALRDQRLHHFDEEAALSAQPKPHVTVGQRLQKRRAQSARRARPPAQGRSNQRSYRGGGGGRVNVVAGGGGGGGGGSGHAAVRRSTALWQKDIVGGAGTKHTHDVKARELEKDVFKSKSVLQREISEMETKVRSQKQQLLHALDSAMTDGATWQKMQATQRDIKAVVKSVLNVKIHRNIHEA